MAHRRKTNLCITRKFQLWNRYQKSKVPSRIWILKVVSEVSISSPTTVPFLNFAGASLVKGIPFDPMDSEISGPDIFSRLVPMEAHEASSLYRFVSRDFCLETERHLLNSNFWFEILVKRRPNYFEKLTQPLMKKIKN